MKIENWVKREVMGLVPNCMSQKGADSIVEIVVKYGYSKQQAQEVIRDALWYSDEDFWRIHSKKHNY